MAAAGPEARLRVALVTSSYNYIKDGIALTLNRLVRYLEDQGVEVLVFAPTGPQPAFAHQGTLVAVASIALPSRPEYRLALGMSRQARQTLTEFKPDIIHIAVPDLLGRRALKLARELNVPAVASYHTRYETYLKHYWYIAGLETFLTRYLRNFYAACRELYVPSAAMAQKLRGDGYRDNFRLWPRGIDAARFDPARRSQAWRTRHGIAPDRPVVLHVSRLVKEKRTDVIMQTARRLRELPHAFVIVGDGPERAEMERAMPDAIFTGFLDGEDLAQAYASSDIFFFPSETESFGNVTLEAMASGLACVCADASGSDALVVDGETGFLCPPGDANAFAGRIEILLRDHDMRRRMGEAARARALRFSWDETMARILSYYRALVAP